jgi:galactose-1-phosphate uridylyltransferase
VLAPFAALPLRDLDPAEEATPPSGTPAQAVRGARGILQETLRRIDAVLESVQLHPAHEPFARRTAVLPLASRSCPSSKIAGFEWGSGFFINPTPPEEAARFLREARVERS